jgi:hypothetical protein
VGSELLFVELQKLETMHADGCLSVQLLIDVCHDSYRLETIDAIVKRFPHCVNITYGTQHLSQTTSCARDTVLHYCARNHCTDAVKRWLPRHTQAGDTKASHDNNSSEFEGCYSLVCNGRVPDKIRKMEQFDIQHWTALHEAIYRNNDAMTLHFLHTLKKSLNERTARYITDAMILMAREMPHVVPEALKLIDTRLIRTESTIQTRIAHQDEVYVIGRQNLFKAGNLPTKKIKADELEERTPDQARNGAWFACSMAKDLAIKYESLTSTVDVIDEEAIWKPLLPSTRVGNKMAQVHILVVQLADFIGPPNKSPFEHIVKQCDDSVCESLIMKAAIDFKWRRLRKWVCMELLFYILSLLVASAAMVSATWASSSGTSSSAASTELATSAFINVMFHAMFALELLLLGYELAQLCVFGSEWLTAKNMTDLVSIVLLLVNAGFYFANYHLHFGSSTVANAGSIGLCLKWLGLLEFLDSFQCAKLFLALHTLGRCSHLRVATMLYRSAVP